MGGKRYTLRWIHAKIGLVAIALASALVATSILLAPSLRAQNPASSSASSNSETAPSGTPTLPRGKKLILKDGSFHLVREYQVEGDRVRFYSIDRSQWEQIPADLVDWNATKAADADQAQRDAAILAKVRNEEAARTAQPLDIDASLEVAPGIFMPPGESLFVFDGKAILPLAQAETNSKLAKGRFLEEVLVPVPVVPTRHVISIQGLHAKFRVQSDRPEFYIRTADAHEPELELIRTKVHGQNRQIENVDQLFGEERATRDTLPLQAWEVAHGVFRFTLGEPLAPGEYAIAEVIQDEGMSVYVWDFGSDGKTAPAVQKSK